MRALLTIAAAIMVVGGLISWLIGIGQIGDTASTFYAYFGAGVAGLGVALGFTLVSNRSDRS